MNWRCKLKHPFEWGLHTISEKRTRPFGYGDEPPEEYDFLLLKCRYCDYVYDSDVTGRPDLDWLRRDKWQ